jgi:hypothetical protein
MTIGDQIRQINNLITDLRFVEETMITEITDIRYHREDRKILASGMVLIREQIASLHEYANCLQDIVKQR